MENLNLAVAQLEKKKSDQEEEVKTKYIDGTYEVSIPCKPDEDEDFTEYQLSMQMAETETQNFTRAGTMFALTTKIRASAVAGRKEELYAALKENGCGDLVYETVNANSLSAFVKEQIAENQDTVPEWLSGLVHVYEQTAVSVRQSAK